MDRGHSAPGHAERTWSSLHKVSHGTCCILKVSRRTQTIQQDPRVKFIEGRGEKVEKGARTGTRTEEEKEKETGGGQDRLL